MGKTSTLIYLFSNIDDNDIVFDDFNQLELTEFENILKFIEENTKKIPEGIVNNIIDFAKNYS